MAAAAILNFNEMLLRHGQKSKFQMAATTILKVKQICKWLLKWSWLHSR